MRRSDAMKVGRAIAAAVLGVVVTLMLPAQVGAQTDYPIRPIRLVVPFAPGGINDAVARLWADKVKDLLGSIVVENHGGAGGMIGAGEVARALPDGYTILLGSSTTQVLKPAVMEHPPYDPLRDFTAVSIIAVATATIAVNPAVPAKTLQELIDYIRANPGKLSYGSAGTGSDSHLAGELFKRLAGGLDIAHVPYRGAGPAISDLIGGHIPVATPHMTAQLLELHNTGKVRVLAVASPVRLEGAPDIPTGAEAGLPGLIGTTFNGIFAPAGTPAAIIARIDAATQAAMQDERFRRSLIDAGFEPMKGLGGTTAQRYVADEYARIMPVVKAIGFKPE